MPAAPLIFILMSTCVLLPPDAVVYDVGDERVSALLHARTKDNGYLQMLESPDLTHNQYGFIPGQPVVFVSCKTMARLRQEGTLFEEHQTN